MLADLSVSNETLYAIAAALVILCAVIYLFGKRP